MYQIIYDCKQKNIIIGYKRVKKQKNYNLKNRKFYILAFIGFDKRFSYYNTSCKVVNKSDKNIKLYNVSNKVNNNKLDKTITGK